MKKTFFIKCIKKIVLITICIIILALFSCTDIFYNAFIKDPSNKPLDPVSNFVSVVGDNNVTPVYDSTYKVNSITDVASQANQIARKWSGAEGKR